MLVGGGLAEPVAPGDTGLAELAQSSIGVQIFKSLPVPGKGTTKRSSYCKQELAGGTEQGERHYLPVQRLGAKCG
jgi:hypothetical protein